MSNQQQKHDSFINSGLSIIDKCSPTLAEEQGINQKIEEINRGWDKLQHKLSEREISLKEMQDLSTRYYEDLQALSEWVGEAADNVDSLSPVGQQPEVIAEQREELAVRYLVPCRKVAGFIWSSYTI